MGRIRTEKLVEPDLGMSQKETTRGRMFWSLIPFTGFHFGYAFLTHSHLKKDSGDEGVLFLGGLI